MDFALSFRSSFDTTAVRTVHGSLVSLAQRGSKGRLDGAKVEAADAQVLAALARAVGRFALKVSPMLSKSLTVTAVGPPLSLGH
jgi:hypothetical protein